MGVGGGLGVGQVIEEWGMCGGVLRWCDVTW